jgi:hypothetical protein
MVERTTVVKYFVVSHSLLLVLGLLFISCQSGSADNAEVQQPSFAPAAGSPISVPAGPGNVITGDVNNDKKLDLLVASGRSRRITILLGKGDGQFSIAANSISLPHPPNELAVGDVDLDGKLDVAVGTHDSYGIMLFRGNGNGGFVSFPGSPVVMRTGDHPHTHGLALADMNRDNKLDLVSVNSTDNDVSVAFGDGRGGFNRAARSPFPVGPSPYPFAIGDVNGDAQLDIVATATATGPMRAQQLPLSRALTLLLADGSGGFRSIQLPIRTGEPWFAVINDINADSKPDIVVTHHDMNQLTVLLGDGRGGFVEATGSPFDFGGKAFHTAVIDVNRDGKMDVIAAGGESMRVMLGDGRGGFAPGPGIRTGPGSWHLALGDVNNDGKLDLITSNLESDTVSVLLAR